MLKIKEKILQHLKARRALQEERDVLFVNLHLANVQVSTLIKEKQELADTLTKERAGRYQLDYSDGDPSPDDTKEREEYINGVLAFFTNSFDKKLQQLIVLCMQDLQNPLNGREYDLQIKGAVNAFSQLLDWRDTLLSERNHAMQEKVNESN